MLASLPRCFSDADCIDVATTGLCQNSTTLNAYCEPIDISLKIVDIKDKAYLSDSIYVMLKRFIPSLKEAFVNWQTEEGRYFTEKASLLVRIYLFTLFHLLPRG